MPLLGGGGGGTVVLVLVRVISSCTGGTETVLLVVAGVASSWVSVRANSNATDTTRETAAMITVTPTTHGHRGVLAPGSGSSGTS